MDSTHDVALKQELRSRFTAYRQRLSDSEYRQVGRTVAERVMGMDVVRRARTVHLYWPMVDARELDTRPLADRLSQMGKQLVLPVVERFEQSGTRAARMTHRSWRQGDLLTPNRWGVLEPAQGKVIDVRDLDIVIVPALGAGRNGHRLGHGLGYYDEFLSQCPAVRICLTYEACLVERLPHESHDIPMHYIVTDQRVLKIESL